MSPDGVMPIMTIRAFPAINKSQGSTGPEQRPPTSATLSPVVGCRWLPLVVAGQWHFVVSKRHSSRNANCRACHGHTAAPSRLSSALNAAQEPLHLLAPIVHQSDQTFGEEREGAGHFWGTTSAALCTLVHDFDQSQPDQRPTPLSTSLSAARAERPRGTDDLSADATVLSR